MTRFFVKPSEISSKNITLSSEQARKIRKVLRMRVGEEIIVFDGQGWEYQCQLTKLTNDYALASITSQELHKNRSNIVLLQSLPKNLKTEFILQKNTELGIDRFIFFESDFSQIDAGRISKEKVSRWRKVVQAASEQSQRLFVPQVDLFSGSLEELLSVPTLPVLKLVLDQNGRMLTDLKLSNFLELCFFVGPEGGFSPNEKELFRKHELVSVTIAPYVLRSETAGMAFLAQLQIVK